MTWAMSARGDNAHWLHNERDEWEAGDNKGVLLPQHSRF